MTDPQQTPRQPHTTAEVRWAAMRALLAEILAKSDAPLVLEGKREILVSALLAGASVRQLCTALNLPKGQVIAVLTRLAQG